MKTKLRYDNVRLKRLVRSTGLSDADIASKIGRKRLQVTRTLNNISASHETIERLVKVANEILCKHAHEEGKEYDSVNWRNFLLDSQE